MDKRTNGLDHVKCDKFINENSKYRKILEILFSNTKYYTHDEIKYMLEEILLKYIKSRDENRTLIILLDNNKIGSEHYFYHIFKNILPKHHICFIDDNSALEYIDIPCDILFLDDWSLSGCHLLYIIDCALYGRKQNNNINITINIIVGLVSAQVIQRVSSLFKDISNVKIMYAECVELLSHYLEDKNISKKKIKEFYKVFSPDIEESAYPVHLDYKVANQFGSYPLIYNYCRQINADKSFMSVANEIKRNNNAVSISKYSYKYKY